MTRPTDIPVIDTLIGFRRTRDTPPVASLRPSDQGKRHPAEYMFRAIPDKRAEGVGEEDAVEETRDAMRKHNIAVGLIGVDDAASRYALQTYPDEFVGGTGADANEGMEAVRKIKRAHDEHGVRAVSTFPAGIQPPAPIDDKRWYPVYAACVELGLPIFVTSGVPGPRIPMAAQHVESLDEVCWFFPELKIVMRHGGDPWTELAVKLMLKWPNLYYSTSAFAPRHYPKAIVDFANSRGADKIIYAGYYPMGLELDRIFTELDDVPFRDHVWPRFLHDNAVRVLGLDRELVAGE